MAYTTINKSTDNFNTVLYTSNNGSSPRTISGVGFQPDFVWVKNRDSASYNHVLNDSVRGLNKILSSDTNGAELAANHAGGYISSANNDGFVITAGSSNLSNYDTGTNKQVVWNWLASNTTVSNTDGSITSTVSANTTAGFSIVSYTGTGANATVGHGLNAVPKMIIVKRRDANDSWWTFNSNLGSNDAYLALQSTAASSTAGGNTLWNSTAPTSSVFSVGTNSGVNGSSSTYVAYCFAEKTGYSKIGSFTGNGNADGTFIYTGFRPAFVLAKSSTSVTEWHMSDDARYPTNPNNAYLAASSSAAEVTGYPTDFLSNGFKIRTTLGGWNSSGATFIYMAIGQSLVGSNNVPCTAR